MVEAVDQWFDSTFLLSIQEQRMKKEMQLSSPSFTLLSNLVNEIGFSFRKEREMEQENP